MWFLNYSNVIDPLLKDLRVFIVKFVEVKAEDRVLDVCCATGDQVFHYARAGAIATGIDSNPRMIEIAVKKQERYRLDNVYFQVADAAKLPFEDSVFDIASISLGLHEVERKVRDKIISEMKRVVKKSGHLIFIDFHFPLPKTYIAYLIKGIEYFAGKRHYKNFRDYLQQGGLPALLKKNNLKKAKRIKNGLFTIIKTKNV